METNNKSVSYIPIDNNFFDMLVATKQQLWSRLLEGATPNELAWMNGYLSGLLSGTATAAVAVQPVNLKITIAYGTETGNAKSLAARLAKIGKDKGLITKVVSLSQYKPADLSKERFLYVVVSTQGDGEPPAAAQPFYDFLHTTSSLFNDLSYAVLALGDSSYPLFCETGKNIDRQLEKLGASRFAPLQLCDIDYEQDATAWFQQSLAGLSGNEHQKSTPAPVTTKSATGGRTIHRGKITGKVNLNDTGSAKETYHIEITTDAVYQPGDALGVVPANPGELVDRVINAAGLSPEHNGSKHDAFIVLQQRNISLLPQRVLSKYAAIVHQTIPAVPLGLAELLELYPLSGPEQFAEVLSILEPVVPRLYSIASSPLAHEGEIHLTVSRNQFIIDGTTRYGLCSDYLSGLKEGTDINFYIQANSAFRLPDPERDVIMIGPGTGIAPFRSFIAEREARGDAGRNWLFFGEQHFVTDFLYQTEIQAWQETGIMTRVNVAFSRDQEEKIYVQHKMLEHSAAFYEWLEAGASVYICGTKDPMSKDVETALLHIIATEGHLDKDQAGAYLAGLEEEDRYHKDVY